MNFFYESHFSSTIIEGEQNKQTENAKSNFLLFGKGGDSFVTREHVSSGATLFMLICTTEASFQNMMGWFQDLLINVYIFI